MIDAQVAQVKKLARTTHGLTEAEVLELHASGEGLMAAWSDVLDLAVRA